VPKTLLAVDDSATMRKVLEITFGGEDFRVVTADGATTALSRLGEEPVAAVIDTSLGSDDGYALAKEMRARDGRLALVIMASRYSPYDANRGRDAGVDDYIDKPFDTQALIEKVKKALLARETREVAKPAPAPVPAPAASTFAASHVPRAPVPAAAAGGPPGATAGNKAAWPTQRTHTLSFEGGLPIVPPPAARPAPAPAVVHSGPAHAPPAAPPAVAPPAAPAPATALPRQPVAAVAPAAPPAPAPVAPPPAVAAIAAANGHLAAKLGDLGLTSIQAEAVLALSREVVERVVWEVVPQLAEALIKEELARLTKD
jgi:DNA-binding response OmpR family regulator